MKDQIYTEKEVLTDALTAEKATTNNYNTFANECVHDNVRQAIMHCLEQEHAIQTDVFNMMHEKGYYPTPAAQEQKVQEAKQKYSQCVKNTNSSMM
ncbi:spore coat protein [Blautia liquoris]|jgi:spore coat protein CotF|uniref:Spore coat protein n=1 Tax=Blautia liquoris TaxID=2779518 RepID=A0A7M2RDX5_9FIRM|nr:spore coat protein [Blautia liquoris]QOV18174.1 spore coat protein [Blautia liquoris]